MLPTVALSLCVLFIALAMMAWHVRGWRKLSDAPPAATDRDYAQSQLRRRMQATGLMAAVALLILASLWLEAMPKWVFIGYVLVMLLLLAWIVVLALADLVASGHHYGKSRTENLAEQARLKGEIYQLQQEIQQQRTGGNGHAE